MWIDVIHYHLLYPGWTVEGDNPRAQEWFNPGVNVTVFVQEIVGNLHYLGNKFCFLSLYFDGRYNHTLNITKRDALLSESL